MRDYYNMYFRPIDRALVWDRRGEAGFAERNERIYAYQREKDARNSPRL